VLRKGIVFLSVFLIITTIWVGINHADEALFVWFFGNPQLGTYDIWMETGTNTITPVPDLPIPDWAQLAGNPQRTGYVDQELHEPWRMKWIWNGPITNDLSDPGESHLKLPRGVQPVVGGGRIYVGHSDGYVRAISEETGKLLWISNHLGADITNTVAYDPESESVYVGTTNGRFWRLDASNGSTIRSNRPGGSILMAPLLVGNVVYIGSTNGLFYGFNKWDLTPVWTVYDAKAPLIGSSAYSQAQDGLLILLAEDRTVHAIQSGTGKLAWRVSVNADIDPLRETVFADTYPVVSEANGVVIIRSYLDWSKMWQPDGGAPANVDGIREFLSNNMEYQSFFVLDLKTGKQLYVAPIMIGAIGNGGDFESTPPQAVIKLLPDGSEVAYVLWRSSQACLSDTCDGREDTTIGEMDLKTGDIRFVQAFKNQGNFRLPSDEQSPLSMAGNTLFHAHWMVLGSLQIIDRAPGYGMSIQNPIKTRELVPVLNTLANSICSPQASHYCGQVMRSPCDGFSIDPGYYIYHANTCIYDQFWNTPVRSAVISNGSIYWKSVDGAIIALQSSVELP
jgi:hypothetical protein